MRNVIGTAAPLTGSTGPLPSAEGLNSGPGPRGGTRRAVGVKNSSFDPVHEQINFLGLRGEDPGSQPIVCFVGIVDRILKRAEAGDRQEGREKLVLEMARGGREFGNGRIGEVTILVFRTFPEVGPSECNFAYGLGLIDGLEMPLHGFLIDDRPHVDFFLGGIPHPH